MKKMLLSTLFIAQVAAAQDPSIVYLGRSPEGLVGNGRGVVRVKPLEFQFHSGGDARGSLSVFVGGKPWEPDAKESSAAFFPGGVVYRLAGQGLRLELLHGSAGSAPYVLAVRAKGDARDVALEVRQSGSPAVAPSGRVAVPMKYGAGEAVLAAGGTPPPGSFSELRERMEAPYKQGLLVHTPSALVNRAVPFNSYLLDLGFDGRLHVCELFRWRDVWSRDLGSGLVPGAMAGGRYSAARATLDYDLERHAEKCPRGLKVTEDPSQGGSAEGVSWLADAVWRYYLLTGDEDFLASAAKTLRPWVEAWLARDYRRTGLLVDVTEWMDHSRFFLFPLGARVLYSNALFAGLLDTFGKIEGRLGDEPAARRLAEARKRFVSGINRVLWNETTGQYDNLSLWDKRDERSSSAENALAILYGVAPSGRVDRILQALKKNNWRAAGSTTIYPPMTHVGPEIDHNYKMWPWWNAVEARARLTHGDPAGGVRLLEACSKTLEDEHFPGMMEELTSPEGVTEGGNAFLTAAGSYQHAIVAGLLGVEILEPRCARIRVSPNVPAEWKDWDATVPLPEGAVALSQKSGKLRIQVTDRRVKTVEAPAGAVVEGAARAAIPPRPVVGVPSAGEKPAEFPALSRRKAAVFFEDGLSQPLPAGLPARRVRAEDLPGLASSDVSALVIAGNALPRKTKSGQDVRTALEELLDSGKALVFYGATMQDRGTMGETGGVIEWYEHRETPDYSMLEDWVFRASRAGSDVPREMEPGHEGGWFGKNASEAGWKPIRVPGAWEEHMKEAYDGWGWYRTHFRLPVEAKGKTVQLDLGAIDDADWTYVNGVLAGSAQGWNRFRRYILEPGSPAYETLVFGGDNSLAVQVADTGGAGGFCADRPRLGIGTTGRFSWTPVEGETGMGIPAPRRSAVVSWGPGDFFNSWETSRGAFGFQVKGAGVEFTGPLAGLPTLAGDVAEAFTDFAVSAPWMFQPLAFTATATKLLVPDEGERYPCVARVVNTATSGEFLLIPASIARTPAGPEVLRRLLIE
jgi:hypothetical protein